MPELVVGLEIADSEEDNGGSSQNSISGSESA